MTQLTKSVEAGFTPGRWKVAEPVGGGVPAVYPDTGKMEFPIAVKPQFLRDDIWLVCAHRIAAAHDLYEALVTIDGEAPPAEPSERPTVGFPPSRDPEADDGNDVVHEAFDEGVARGLWIAANIARAALSSARGNQS